MVPAVGQDYATYIPKERGYLWHKIPPGKDIEK
jgi:hypothetical protein